MSGGLKFTSGSCQGNWAGGETDPAVIYMESRPGTWDVRLTVTYAQDSSGDPPHAPTVITKSVTIAPATHFTTVGGMDTATAYTNNIVLKFRVDAASRPCGPYIEYNVAQEKITEQWRRVPPYDVEYPADIDWVPEEPVEAFHLAGNETWDTHTNGITPSGWATILEGDPFLTCKQYLRIKYVDPCSETKYINLGSHVLTWKKVDANNWKITEFFP
jgi:hypothetical protein